MTNSGGAIATLSFLGASEKTLSLIPAKISLFLFITGIFLVGIAIAKTYHYMSGLFKSYMKDVNEYFGDNKSWKQLRDDDDKRIKVNFWDYFYPYASFACFIFGCISGAFALFSGA